MSVKPSNSRKTTLFWIFTLAIPVILFALVEFSFRVTNIGSIPPLFKEVQLNSQAYFVPNRDFAKRYFKNTSVTPTASNDVFRKTKKPNTFRVFALGGSSMAGFPYHYNGMMSHVVRDVLEDGFPNKEIEVINLGISAVNSYTIYDMVEEVIEHEPDLILFYAGHNEYYGALGVGSSESLGKYPAFIRLYLKLQNLHTFVALKNAISNAVKLIASAPDKGNATLMEQMVGEQKIPFGSENYLAGINQFESNFLVIMNHFKKEGIPVIAGNLVSNLKDFPPFISVGEAQENASYVYGEAKKLLGNKEEKEAKKAFIQAKDLDALRFRAPSEINEVISKVAKKEKLITADVASLFAVYSKNNIVGNELMLEHLHPNDKGYFLLGWAYALEVTKYLSKNNYPDWIPQNVKPQAQYEQMAALSAFDKRVAAYRIASIESGWPFQEPGVNLPYLDKFTLSTIADSLALENFTGKANWQEAKDQLANYYVTQKELRLALIEINGILRAFPWRVDILEKKASILNEQGNTTLAIETLIKANKQRESVFNTKILGALLLQTNRLEEGLPYLKRAFELQPNDAQNLYNLSGAYGIQKDFTQARIYLDKLMAIAPNFPGAKEWQSQLNVLSN